MDLESVILSETSQRRSIVWHPLYVESKNKWHKCTYLQNSNRLTDLENESVVASGKDGGIVMEFGEDMHTPLYLKWVITRDLLYSTRDPAQCYMAVWMGGNLQENGYMYMDAYSLHSASETITTLFVNQL